MFHMEIAYLPYGFNINTWTHITTLLKGLHQRNYSGHIFQAMTNYSQLESI